jgi:intracellular septation protein A
MPHIVQIIQWLFLFFGGLLLLAFGLPLLSQIVQQELPLDPMKWSTCTFQYIVLCVCGLGLIKLGNWIEKRFRG